MSSTEEINKYKIEVEDYLHQLTQRLERLYKQRCSSDCSQKTYGDCYHEAPDLQCYTEFAEQIESCPLKGAALNYDYPIGRCSNDVDCNTSENREIICGWSTLFDDEKHDDGLTLKFDSSTIKKYAYAGAYNTFKISFPYHKSEYTDDQGTCKEYDPRYRPWYVAASSGAKNIIIVYDISGSMKTFQRYEKAEYALKEVLSTLGESDFYQIIKFSDSEQDIITETDQSKNTQEQNLLLQATKENIKKSKQNIETTEYFGGTNYELAFKKTFDIFNYTNNKEVSSQGENIVLFITDGDISEGKGNEGKTQEIIDYIDELNNELQVSIFTYTLGDDAVQDTTTQIACQNRGISENIKDSASKEDIGKILRSYQTYLQSSTNITEPVWSSKYLDFSTNLPFVTVAQPIYDIQNSVQRVIAVAAIDLSVDQLQYLNGYEDYMKNLQDKTRNNFTKSTLNECDLEKLRTNKCKNTTNYQFPQNCDATSDTQVTYSTCRSDKFKGNKAFYQEQTEIKNLSICCQQDTSYTQTSQTITPEKIEETNSTGLILGLVFGLIGFILVVIAIFWCWKRNRKPQQGEQGQQQNQNKEDNQNKKDNQVGQQGQQQQIQNQNNQQQKNQQEQQKEQQQIPIQEDNNQENNNQVDQQQILNQQNQNQNQVDIHKKQLYSADQIKQIDELNQQIQNIMQMESNRDTQQQIQNRYNQIQLIIDNPNNQQRKGTNNFDQIQIGELSCEIKGKKNKKESTNANDSQNSDQFRSDDAQAQQQMDQSQQAIGIQQINLDTVQKGPYQSSQNPNYEVVDDQA